MRRVLASIAVVAAAALAACGGGSPRMNGDAAKELDARVTAVRTAVVARDRSAAEVALDDLRAAVDRLRRDDALSDERADAILGAASDVSDQLVTITTTTTTTTTTVPPTPPSVDDNGNQGNGKGKGKNGKGGD